MTPALKQLSLALQFKRPDQGCATSLAASFRGPAVETKPWLVEALRAGLGDHYTGLKSSDVPAGAAALKDRVGSLPDYMAEQVDKGVARALAAYGAFYRQQASGE